MIYIVVGKNKHSYICNVLDGCTNSFPLIIVGMGAELDPSYTVKQIHNLIKLESSVDVYITTSSLFVITEFDLVHLKYNIDVKLINTDIKPISVTNIEDRYNTNLSTEFIDQYKRYIDLF